MKKRSAGNSVRRTRTAFITAAALFTALTVLATRFFSAKAVPVLGAPGIVTFADAVIFAAAFVLGPLGGAVAGGLGSALGALCFGLKSGIIYYAPFWFAVKGAAGFLCGYAYRKIFKEKAGIKKRIFPIIIAALTIIAGLTVSQVVLGAIQKTEVFLPAAKTLLVSLIEVAVSGLAALAVSPFLPELHI